LTRPTLCFRFPPRAMNWSASSRSLFPCFNVRMLELTRPPARRSEHHRQECWHIYYGDVHVGTILPSALAIRMTPIRASGPAASIRARIPANISPTPPRRRRGPRGFRARMAGVLVEAHLGRFSRHGANSEIGPNGNMRAVGCWPAAGAAKPWTGQACPSLSEVSLR
jgi:hypothetical protein